MTQRAALPDLSTLDPEALKALIATQDRDVRLRSGIVYPVARNPTNFMLPAWGREFYFFRRRILVGNWGWLYYKQCGCHQGNEHNAYHN